MIEFKGMKLEQCSTNRNEKWKLIFHCGDEYAQELGFETEEEARGILNKMINGEGVKGNYSFQKETVELFPHHVMLFNLEEEYGLSEKDCDFLRSRKREDCTYTDEVNFPKNHRISPSNNRYALQLVLDK